MTDERETDTDDREPMRDTGDGPTRGPSEGRGHGQRRDPGRQSGGARGADARRRDAGRRGDRDRGQRSGQRGGQGGREPHGGGQGGGQQRAGHGQGPTDQRRGQEPPSRGRPGGQAADRGTQGPPGGTGGRPQAGAQSASGTARPQQATRAWTDKSVIDRYGKSFLVILAALFATAYVPMVSSIRFVPMLKEAVLGAVVVVAFTPITTAKGGVKYALAAGMTAAVVFNLVNIPLQLVIGGLVIGGQGGSAGAMGSFVAGLGALSNLVGLVFFSPLGYFVGGAVGSQLNG